MGNNMSPYIIGMGENYTYFLSIHFNIFENDRFEEGTFFNAANNSLDLFVYHLGKCGVDSYKTLKRSQIHTLPTFFRRRRE